MDESIQLNMQRLPHHNMKDRSAQMSSDALARYKEAWRSAEVEFKDEISMVGCDIYFQIYHRSLTAKSPFCLPDGRVVPNIASCDSGDFMQLPPVEKFALFEDIPVDRKSSGLWTEATSHTHPSIDCQHVAKGRRRTQGGAKEATDPAQVICLRERDCCHVP